MLQRWHLASLFIAMILLASLLAACGGGGNAPTGTTPSGSSASLPTTSGSFPTYTSTVTFTLTGGEQGTYTVSENAHGATNNPSQLMMLFRDHSGKEFNMTLNGYTGPGSYTLVPQSTIVSDNLEIGLSDQTSWDLASVVSTLPAGSSLSQITCSVTIASDTPVASAVIGGLHRLTGSFSCPKLAATPGFQQAAPITVTNGQLDVYFQFLSS